MSISYSESPMSDKNKRRSNHLARTNGRCWYCGVEISLETLQLDHFVAKSKGGKGRGNFVPSCGSCNAAKGGRTLDEFRWTRTRQRDNIPYISPEAKMWLSDQGIEIPTTAPFLFWFETEGLG